MKKLLLSLLIVIMVSSLYAGKFIETSDHNFLYVGGASPETREACGIKSTEAFGFSDAYIIKYNAKPEYVSDAVFGGEGSEYFSGVCEAADGTYIAVGCVDAKSIGTGKFTGMKGVGGQDLFLVKFDKDLKVLDETVLGTAGDDQVNDIFADKEGNIFVIGSSLTDAKKAYAYKLSEDLTLIKTATHVGSHKKARDAKYTDFEGGSLIKGGELLLYGFSSLDINTENEAKVFMVIYDKNLTVKKYQLYYVDDIHIYGIAEKEDGFIGVGTLEENDKMYGYVLNVDKELMQKSKDRFSAIDDEGKPDETFFFTVHPYKEGFFVTGDTFDKTEDIFFPVNFGIIYKGDKFGEVISLPQLTNVEYVKLNDTDFATAGFEGSKFVIKKISLK
ncbi:MAG: hypothetical protein IJS60_01855 [Abditibacteriota bacterium]|nr:hypothetical protein [Abditibacteriota bacterium]